MTYKQIQDDVLDRLNQDNSTTTSGPRTRIKRFINEWYHRLLALPGMSRVRQSATTISAIASTASYTVTAASIRNIYDATNDWNLEERSIGWLRERDPGSDATGNPIVFVITSRTATTLGVTLWPTPTSNGTLNVDAEIAVTDLSGDGDIPIIPIDYHYLLGEGALLNEYMRLGDIDRGHASKQFLDEGKRSLRVFLFSTGTSRLNPGRRARAAHGRSRLGSNFPSDW